MGKTFFFYVLEPAAGGNVFVDFFKENKIRDTQNCFDFSFVQVKKQFCLFWGPQENVYTFLFSNFLFGVF